MGGQHSLCRGGSCKKNEIITLRMVRCNDSTETMDHADQKDFHEITRGGNMRNNLLFLISPALGETEAIFKTSKILEAKTWSQFLKCHTPQTHVLRIKHEMTSIKAATTIEFENSRSRRNRTSVDKSIMSIQLCDIYLPIGLFLVTFILLEKL